MAGRAGRDQRRSAQMVEEQRGSPSLAPAAHAAADDDDICGHTLRSPLFSFLAPRAARITQHQRPDSSNPPNTATVSNCLSTDMPPMAPPPPPLPVSAAALQAHILLKLEGHAGRAGPSLAQRLGLVPRPAPPLSPQGWLEVRRRSLLPVCMPDVHLSLVIINSSRAGIINSVEFAPNNNHPPHPPPHTHKSTGAPGQPGAARLGGRVRHLHAGARHGAPGAALLQPHLPRRLFGWD